MSDPTEVLSSLERLRDKTLLATHVIHDIYTHFVPAELRVSLTLRALVDQLSNDIREASDAIERARNPPATAPTPSPPSPPEEEDGAQVLH
jgi:hypothetical protein